MNGNVGGDGRRPARPVHLGIVARLRHAPATAGLLCILVVVFLASVANPDLAWRFAKIPARVRTGEAWRVVTANFFHGGLLHLAVNAYALSMIGPTVEQVYGRIRFLIVFILGGAAGYVASTALVVQPSLGASAGIFALLGALLGFALRARHTLAPHVRAGLIREILIVAAINLAFGFMVSYVDNAAHVGGFLGGLALSVVLRQTESA